MLHFASRRFVCGAPGWAPHFCLAATAVVVAAAVVATVVAAAQAIAAAVAEQEDQDDNPADVAATETVIVAHK